MDAIKIIVNPVVPFASSLSCDGDFGSGDYTFLEREYCV